jgi:hypothetical protein
MSPNWASAPENRFVFPRSKTTAWDDMGIRQAHKRKGGFEPGWAVAYGFSEGASRSLAARGGNWLFAAEALP